MAAWRPKTQRRLEDRELNQARSKPDTVDWPVRTARIFVQYCPGSHTTENLFSTTWLRYGLWCTTDASPFAMTAGWEAFCCDHLNLAYSQVCASANLDCSCLWDDARSRHIGLLWERLSQLVDLGLLFYAVARERHRGVRTQCRRCLHLVWDGLRFITALPPIPLARYQHHTARPQIEAD